jgi:hypothetical protein
MSFRKIINHTNLFCLLSSNSAIAQGNVNEKVKTKKEKEKKNTKQTSDFNRKVLKNCRAKVS